MADTEPTVVELTVDVPDHILVDGRALCGASVDWASVDTRVVADELPVIADASTHLCMDCFERWQEIRGEVNRMPTVRCHCDRVEPDVRYRCARVVPAHRARGLQHPAAPDGPRPVCPDCYEWIRECPGNSVSAPYEEAAAWD